jgi:iron complex outermembrane receptor protein
MDASVNTLLFPDGFKGRIKPDVWNVSGIAGAKGVEGKEIFWEYSSAYGSNSSKYYSENTNNASQQFLLGKNAPTTFYTGALKYQQLTNTLHFTKNILNGGSKIRSLNIDWGAELRLENFRTKPGEEASWKNYDITGKKNGGSQTGLVVRPEYALNKNRNVACTYVDLEGDFNERLLLNLAGRFEHYSDFGGNIAAKLAARYKLGGSVSIRGSVSNGFRAPSMQQRYWSYITNGYILGSVTPTRSGIFNNESDVAKLFGVPSLEAEKSLNFSGGVTSTISPHIYLTIDGYWIQIKDRVVLGGRFNKSNPEVERLLRASSLGDSTIIEVSFFSNAISTRTKGIDIVLHGKWNLNNAQLLGTLSANCTRTHLYGDIKTAANLSASDSNKNTLFNTEQISNLEDGQPRSKIILSLDYKREKIGFVVRNTRFGGTAFQHVVAMTGKIQPQENFSPKILTDVSINYTPKSPLTFTAGANNIFDVYPDRIKNYENTNNGIYIYAMEASPFGFNGGYYFVAMSFNF